MHPLAPLGYSKLFEHHAAPFVAQGMTIARVSEEHRTSYTIRTERLEISAEVTGKLMFTAEGRSDYPAVGDWVAATLYDNDEHAIIHAVLPRTSVLLRKAIGKRLEEQIIAANTDFVFAVQAMDQTFNPRRLERLLVLARESGAEPIALLSKKDICLPEYLDSILTASCEIAGDSTVISYAINSDDDIAAIRAFIQPGRTFCLIGPSGSGKSTLINRLAEREILATGEVREYNAKGRHTTTRRELVLLEQGGVLIDTPGLRELGLWDSSAGLEETFDDIIDLAAECHFVDCTHTHEPDCAVKKAIEEGILEEARYDGYVKLLKEQHALEARMTLQGALKKKQHDKMIAREIKRIKKKGKK
jgi:ribosome biogenesis GTPase